MDKNDFAWQMIRDVATRQNMPHLLPGNNAISGPPGLGARPRIGAVLDQMAAKDGMELATAPGVAAGIILGPYIFFPAENYLESENGVIRLTEKERDILLALLGAQGHVVSREDLLDSVWGYASGVETHTLETHIYRLRQKIESRPAQPALLLTVENGYALRLDA